MGGMREKKRGAPDVTDPPRWRFGVAHDGRACAVRLERGVSLHQLGPRKALEQLRDDSGESGVLVLAPEAAVVLGHNLLPATAVR